MKMVTRRSLNKLERKAHMSIHNTKEVKDGDEPLSSFTKDRFGKKHKVVSKEGEEGPRHG